MERSADREEILKRLRRVEGQVRGIQRMICEERSCEAIVTQLMAARAALDKASLYIMSHRIEACLLEPDGTTGQQQLERIISFFLKFAGSVPGEEELAVADTDDE